jgi:hypothetical protein
MGAITESRLKILGIAGAFILLLILPPLLPSYWLTILTQMLIFGVLAMSLDILMGYTGLPSHGIHGASLFWSLRLLRRVSIYGRHIEYPI